MDIVDLAILKKMVSGGGGSGTDNYNDLLNLPKINGETLAGNKTAENLGLQDALTFDSTPTEDSTNPVESGGVYSELAKKQDNLTFDGTYDASTNKAATESTVTNAINELDVSATSFDADETISSISETDGKVSVTKQDIAIASNQVVAMTGYAKPSSAPANPAIQANDTANQAIGKLEFKADTNQTNILLVQDATKELVDKGAKNLVDFSNLVSLVTQHSTVTKTDTTITVSSTDTWGYQSYLLNLPAGKYELSFNATAVSISSGTMFIAVFPGQTATGQLVRVDVTSIGAKHGSFEWTGGELNISFYANPSNTQIINSMTITDVMICTEADWKISQNYTPFALPNYDLTVREAEDRAALIECVDEGAKNIFDFANAIVPTTQNPTNATYSKNNDSITVNSNGSWGRIIIGTPIALKAGNYVFSCTISNYSKNNGKPMLYLQDNVLIGNAYAYTQVTGNGKYVLPFTLPTDHIVYVAYYGNASEISGSTDSYTASENMICTEAYWKISQQFVPYALPNTDLTRMVNDLQKKAVKVYTYHVNPNESDPEDAVTYLDDATGLTPAKMGASSFSYGSWANAWFLPRPCMLKSDGTVAYYLNPNDYSKKTDGTASDIADANFDGNVMLEFPKIWVKRVNDGNGARTVSIAPVNVDGTYKCWSNINAEDKEIDHFYLPAYNGTIHSSKMRSLSGVTLNATYAPNYTRAQEVTAATANNPTGKNMWYTETWADFCLVYDLLYLMGKSLDLQRTFGQGLSSGSETAMRAYVTGTHNAKGLFYGDISGTSTAVKVLGMENLWGCRWHGVAGLIDDNGTLKVKMTYGVADGSTAVGYNTTGSGYLNYGSTYGTNGFVKKMQADNTMGYKIIETAGTDATYYCDNYYVNNSISAYALLGGHADGDASCGFYVSLNVGAAYTFWSLGGSLSCRP